MAWQLADSCIFIDILRGNEALANEIDSRDIVICLPVAIEIIQGAMNKNEQRKLERYLAQFEVVSMSSNTMVKVYELVRTYHLSHRLRISDALIAATAIEHKLDLITYNMKDFRFIRNLKSLPPESEPISA